MGYLDESNQTSEDLESENATTNSGNEATVHSLVPHDESIQFSSNKKLISFTSSSSSISSSFSVEDLQILDGEHDKSSLMSEDDGHLATKHDENHNEDLSESGSPTIELMEHAGTSKYGVPSHVFARKGPGNWSMASNESLFSIHMGSISFCHLDSFSPAFVDGQILEAEEENNQGSGILNEPTYEEDKGNHFSATSSSSSESFVFPVLTGEAEEGGSPYPRGSLIGPAPQSPPAPEPAPVPLSKSKASEDEIESKETTAFVVWTKWFPCFRYCACCS